MSTLADSLVDAASRPLLVRMRPDLSFRKHYYQGRVFWVVKEPVGLKYFRFEEEEFAILEMLDGQASMDDIKRRFEREFAPQKIAYSDLQHFVGNLFRSGLLIADAPGQGEHLYRRKEKTDWNKFAGSLTNILALRFRGIDPERLLNFLDGFTWWFFTRWAVMFNCLFGLSAILLVAVQWETFQARLPAFDDFFGAGNWLWLGGTLAAVKVLHEFGHGLSCKRLGGECHEMGFMMLVLTPCLYCNVSDSWMLPNKWHRAAIGAAGMYVELFLASVATFAWWFSEPGLLNFLCLRIMFVCSMSTVLFNGNPLMRYDGYYILADILEIPNLRQKSSDILRRLTLQHCLGIEQQEDPFLPKRNQLLFALYTVAAVAYRWLVVVSIFLFLNSVLEPYGLKPIGQVFAIAGVVGMLVQPIWGAYKMLRVPGRLDQVKAKNVLATLSIVAGMVLLVAFLRLPHWVRCVLEVAPKGATLVYVEVPGRLAHVRVKPGDQVQAGDELARLESPELELQYLELKTRLNEARAQLEGLRNVMSFSRENANAASDIGRAEETKKSLEDQVVRKETERERLVIRAPVDGVVLPTPQKASDGMGARRLATWSGSPLDERNRGAWLNSTEVVCQIGDPKSLEVVLVIDQNDIEYVRSKSTVHVLLDAFPGRTLETTIEEISGYDVKNVPTSLTNRGGGEVATKNDPSGAQAPLSASYQARAALNDPEGLAQLGLRGRAKVYTEWIPLAPRIWRYLAQTFHFRM